MNRFTDPPCRNVQLDSKYLGVHGSRKVTDPQAELCDGVRVRPLCACLSFE